MTHQDPLSLAGCKLLVTGGNRGIGAAIAMRAARAGADVAVGYHQGEDRAESVVDEIRDLGRTALALSADVSRGEEARQLVADVADALGGIDCLVNNAGIMPETPFLEIDAEEWDRVIATDLTAAFHTTQAVLPSMLEQSSGVIVNVSSRLGQIGWAGVSHYATAKAGLLGLTKSLAREFGPRGIRVNAVAPGVTVTDMTAHIVESDDGTSRVADTPAGRYAVPDDVAAAVVFLLSDDAAMFHGQTLNPNGGGFMP